MSRRQTHRKNFAPTPTHNESSAPRAAHEGKARLRRMSTPVQVEARTVAALRVVADVREFELLAKIRAERAELERKRPVDVITVRRSRTSRGHIYISRDKAPWFFLLLDNLDFRYYPEDGPRFSRYGGVDLPYERTSNETAKEWAAPIGSNRWAYDAMYSCEDDELRVIFDAIGYSFEPLSEGEKKYAEEQGWTDFEHDLNEVSYDIAPRLEAKLAELFSRGTQEALALTTEELAEAPSLRILATVSVHDNGF